MYTLTDGCREVVVPVAGLVTERQPDGSWIVRTELGALRYQDDDSTAYEIKRARMESREAVKLVEKDGVVVAALLSKS